MHPFIIILVYCFTLPLSESDVDLVSMATGMTTNTDSAFGTLTTCTATRSQVTTGASQFSEVSSSV
jgi:hypothetical protein